jgi:hypothetical protein
MHITRLFTIPLLVFAIGVPAQSQLLKKLYKDVEVFVGTGTTNYFGDIGGKDMNISGVQAVFDNLDIDLWQTRMMLVGGARFTPAKNFAVSMLLSPVFIRGSDLRSNYAWRGYEFKTSIFEASVQGEYYFANRLTGIAPYGFAGLGGMVYSIKNNQSTTRSKWYPGNTFIFGLGSRFPAKNRLTHTLDFSFHFTASDFLDGYSTPRKSKDLFFVLSYKANFELLTKWYFDHRGLVR